MSVTTKTSTVTASAAPPRTPGLTQSQRDALQKFTVWRNSFDDRGDLFGGAAINAMLLQDIVCELARAADELSNIAHKPVSNRLGFADVTKIVGDLLVPINEALGKLQARIDAGAAQTATYIELVRHDIGQAQEALHRLDARTDMLDQATRQNHDRIESVNAHVSNSVAQAMQQLERIEEHVRRHDRETVALRERLDTITGNVERFVAEADWDLIRSLISLGERVKCLEDAEPRPAPQPPARGGVKRT
jgi:methyl-accepting chemotaxis protein